MTHILLFFLTLACVGFILLVVRTVWRGDRLKEQTKIDLLFRKDLSKFEEQ